MCHPYQSRGSYRGHNVTQSQEQDKSLWSDVTYENDLLLKKSIKNQQQTRCTKSCDIFSPYVEPIYAAKITELRMEQQISGGNSLVNSPLSDYITESDHVDIRSQDRNVESGEEVQQVIVELTPVTRRPRVTHPGCSTIKYNRKSKGNTFQQLINERRRIHFCNFPGKFCCLL